MSRWNRFWLIPITAEPLAALRICMSLCLLWQIWLLRDVSLDLLSRDGIVQENLAVHLGAKGAPRIQTFVELLSPWHISEMNAIAAISVTLILALVFLLFGFLTPLAAVLSWFCHWVLTNSAYSTSYGVDLFTHVFLFYLVFVPSGRAWSVDAFLWPSLKKPSYGAGLGLRILQLHMCIMYLSSGIEKALGVQWWNGELMWRALTLPEYRVYDFEWLAHWPHLAQFIGLSALVTELGYVFFIWPRQTRPLWIVMVVGMHLGIAFFLNLTVFGVTMAFLTPVLFGVRPIVAGYVVGQDSEAIRPGVTAPA